MLSSGTLFPARASSSNTRSTELPVATQVAAPTREKSPSVFFTPTRKKSPSVALVEAPTCERSKSLSENLPPSRHSSTSSRHSLRNSSKTPSQEHMQIDQEHIHIDDDDDFNNDQYFDPLQSPIPKYPELVTKDDFNYAINLLNEKLSAMFKLLKYISDQQKRDTAMLEKIVVANELSEDFWNKAYKEISKELVLTILFPSQDEYREALEKYLDLHANHYIDSIGINNWTSLFSVKLLPDLKTKCRSKRNDFNLSIRNTMFSIFGEQQLERVDNNTSSVKIAEWKKDPKTQAAYQKLFTNHELLSKIGYTVFKQYKGKELLTMHCAFVLSICDIMLNPKSPRIKYNDKSVTRRVHAFLRAFESQTPVTPEIMQKIAEREVEESRNKNNQGVERNDLQSIEDSTIADDNDYDSFINNLNSQFMNE